MRFRDLLIGSKFESRINIILEESQENFLRELGKNDFYHSKSIENILDRLVPDHIKSNQKYFDTAEIFFLIISIYLHDIGRKTDSDYHEIESYNQIQEHPYRYHLNEHEAEAIAQICAAHAKENEWPLSRNNANYGILGYSSNGRTFNLQVLGALLRIGDELDNTYIRAKGITNQSGSIRNIIRDINPVYEKRIVEIQASPKTWQDYYTLVKVRDYTQSRLNEVKSYLKNIELDYYQIWLDPENFSASVEIDYSCETHQSFVIKLTGFLQSISNRVEIYEKFGSIELPIVSYSNTFGVETVIGIIPTINLNTKKSEEFIGALTSLLHKKNIDIGWVISYESFDDNIFTLFKKNGIKVSKYSDFLNGVFNFKEGLSGVIKEYRNTEIYKRGIFINSKGLLENGYEIDDLETYLHDWLEDPNEIQLTLLGDFGVGKTTLVDKLAFDLSIKFIQNNNMNRIPLNIKLKELINSTSIESLITSILVNKLKLKINYEIFNSLNKEGHFIIILDGFDEIADLTNEENVLKAFREIDKVVEPKSKIILTCRTHFFKTTDHLISMQANSKLHDQIKFKYGYKIAFVQDFTPEQVIEYVSKWDEKKVETYTSIISSIYNLSDLSLKPVLLNIIVKTIPQLDSLKDSIINSSSLYSIYTRFWLERDDWRTNIEIQERKMLAISLAYYFFENKISFLNYTNIKDTLNNHQFPIKNYPSDILDYELRTCNFLKRDGAGNYSFVHKSFLEFLLANGLEIELFSKKKKILTNWYLPLEKPDKKKYNKVPNEAESFFIQLCQVRLSEYNSSSIIELIYKQKRAQQLMLIAISKLSVKDFGVAIAYIILNQKWDIDISLALKLLHSSNDQIAALLYFKNNIKVYYDQSFASMLIEAIKKEYKGTYKFEIEEIEKEMQVLGEVTEETDVEVLSSLINSKVLLNKKIEYEYKKYLDSNPGVIYSHSDPKYKSIKTKIIREYGQQIKKQKRVAEKEEKLKYDEYLKTKRKNNP